MSDRFKPVDLDALDAVHGAARALTKGAPLCLSWDDRDPDFDNLDDPDWVVGVPEDPGDWGSYFQFCEGASYDRKEPVAARSIIALHNAYPAMSAELRALWKVRDAAEAHIAEAARCAFGRGCYEDSFRPERPGDCPCGRVGLKTALREYEEAQR